MTSYSGQEEYFEDCDTEELYKIWESLGDEADESFTVKTSWRKKDRQTDSLKLYISRGEGGLVLFAEVQDAMRAEKVLKSAGYATKMVAPPPDMRRGCDLALEINLVEQIKYKDSPFTGIYPINVDTATLLNIVKITDLGEWLMIKAGNMKLTFDKATGIIVNTSGVGCPDIPYFHAEMIDRHVQNVVRPREVGFTLCAWMLDRALEKALDIQKGDTKS